MPDSPEDKGFGQGDPLLARWAEQLFAPEDEVLREIRQRSVASGLPAIAVGRMDGLHLELLARASGARKLVEIGTLGGYSGVCLLRGAGPGGFLHTFEYSPQHAAVARESFRRAGVEGQVRLHLGRALEQLGAIAAEGPFDLVFIDADKPGYPDYLAWAAEHLRVGGMVLGDNAFGWGRVLTPGGDESARALLAFNESLARGGRFRATMLPTEEGLALGVKLR
jgi:caffeoyl-CoA O-methyltransferase